MQGMLYTSHDIGKNMPIMRCELCDVSQYYDGHCEACEKRICFECRGQNHKEWVIFYTPIFCKTCSEKKWMLEKITR